MMIPAALILLAALGTGNDPPPSTPEAPSARSGARPAEPEVLFSDANSAFLAGATDRAVEGYQALLTEGVASPELEVNLGVALARKGDAGAAALHLERALLLDTSDSDARADLADVRRRAPDRFGAEEASLSGFLSQLSEWLPGTALSIGLLASWVLGWLLLGLRALELARPRVAWLVLAFGLSGVLAVGTATASWARAQQGRRAVVMVPAVTVREGPAPTAQPRFELHAATAVTVADVAEGYLRVELPNGLAGWVPDTAVERVLPREWSGSR